MAWNCSSITLIKSGEAINPHFIKHGLMTSLGLIGVIKPQFQAMHKQLQQGPEPAVVSSWEASCGSAEPQLNLLPVARASYSFTNLLWEVTHYITVKTHLPWLYRNTCFDAINVVVLLRNRSFQSWWLVDVWFFFLSILFTHWHFQMRRKWINPNRLLHPSL